MNGLVELMYQALAAERFGIKVRTEDPERLRQKLYQARKGYAEFSSLAFILSPFSSNVLFIAKQGKSNAEEQ